MHAGEEKGMQGFGGEIEGKRLLGKPRHRLEDNIKMDLKERAWIGLIWLTIGTSGILL
jgi:hypothetical protein